VTLPAVGRWVEDRAIEGMKEIAWHGIEAAVDVVHPGLGTTIKQARTIVRAVETALSFEEGHGLTVDVPLLTDATTGFSFGVRAVVGDRAGPVLSRLGPSASWHPVDLPTRFVLDVGPAPDPGEVPPPVESPAASEPPGLPYRGTRVIDETGRVTSLLVVVSRAEVRAATAARRVDAEALVRFVETESTPAGGGGARPAAAPAGATWWGTAPHRASVDRYRVITFIDPDVDVGLVAVAPPRGRPYCPLVFEVVRGEVRVYSLPHRPSADSDEGTADRTVPVSAWPELLDELIDRFGGPPDLLVRTAIGASAVTPVVTAAMAEYPDRTASRLREVGAYATAYLVGVVAAFVPDVTNARSVRFALQEVVAWGVAGGSASADECRIHVAYLLATEPMLGAVREAVHRDAALGEASRVRRVLTRRTRPSVPPHDPESFVSDDELIEYIVEQLEYIAERADPLAAALSRTRWDSGV